VKVAIDVNPLAGPRTGIGIYTQHLVRELPLLPDAPDLIGVQLSLRSRTLQLDIPVRRVPVPAAALHAIWSKVAFPPVTWLTGRADVVHGPNFVAPPAGKAATVITVHDLTYVRFPELVNPASLRYRDLVQAAIRRGAFVLTPSETIAAEVRDTYRIDEDRVFPTLLGVDPSWTEPADQARLPPEVAELNGDYLVFVGSLEPRKNLKWLLRAFTLASRSGKVPTLVLVGPAGWGDQLDFSDRPPLLLGYQETAAVQAIVAGARAMVCPARYEGFGLTPLEALAAGTPVIASGIDVHREVLGNFARFVALDDDDALAEALLEPPVRTPAWLESARSWVAVFRWSDTAAATLFAYRCAAAAR
jgi:glycosyltransferase involved in cell wall biosynthesis